MFAADFDFAARCPIRIIYRSQWAKTFVSIRDRRYLCGIYAEFVLFEMQTGYHRPFVDLYVEKMSKNCLKVHLVASIKRSS
jgi:hypothetical protein